MDVILTWCQAVAVLACLAVSVFLKQHLSQKDKLVVCDTANLDKHSDSIASLLKCFYILQFSKLLHSILDVICARYSLF